MCDHRRHKDDGRDLFDTGGEVANLQLSGALQLAISTHNYALMPEHIDVVIIGAGVIGLACARALARCGLDVVILENDDDFGLGTSACNSEVIHAGIYYPIGSLKARLCVTGREAIYAFCSTYGVELLRCRKLIVATTPQQVDSLDTIRARALPMALTICGS